jgi:hypothetical protein
LDAKDRAFIAYVGASKVFGSLESAKRLRDILTYFGKLKWMPPVMKSF